MKKKNLTVREMYNFIKNNTDYISDGWLYVGYLLMNGYKCKCGKLYPEIEPFAPFNPAPLVCGYCGRKRNNYKNITIFRATWKRKKSWRRQTEKLYTDFESLIDEKEMN